MKKERKEQGSKKEKKINLDKTRGATAYIFIIGESFKLSFLLSSLSLSGL